jgi:hypothetical protein
VPVPCHDIVGAYGIRPSGILDFEGSSNGRTADFGSAYVGSIPTPSTTCGLCHAAAGRMVSVTVVNGEDEGFESPFPACRAGVAQWQSA